MWIGYESMSLVRALLFFFCFHYYLSSVFRRFSWNIFYWCSALLFLFFFKRETFGSTKVIWSLNNNHFIYVILSQWNCQVRLYLRTRIHFIKKIEREQAMECCVALIYSFYLTSASAYRYCRFLWSCALDAAFFVVVVA